MEPLEIENADAAANDAKYRAPALEKGLDVLELLVTEARPLTMSEICQRLQRSQGEMFRMVQVLQSREFVDQDEASGGYFLTDRLFTMAMRQPNTRTLVEIALPRMRQLAMRVEQSCHLAMYARGEIVVVARMESTEQIGFSVRVGYRRSIVSAVSGTTLFGFQPVDVREHWLDMIDRSVSRADIKAFVERAEKAREQGYARAASSFVNGVTDISAPIIRGDRAAAALTIPYLKHANTQIGVAEATREVMAMAAEISAELVAGDSRA